MSLLRFLGLGRDEVSGESAPIQEIASKLEALPAEHARYVAAFAFVLGRVAHADLEVDASELEEMHRIVAEDPSLDDESAQLVVQIVRSQAEELAGGENYLVTREFRRLSDRHQRLHLLRCLYAVAAADGSISTTESSEIVKIGEEIGFSRSEVNAVRVEWRDLLAEIQAHNGSR